jgi:hypothetical protein
VQPVVSGPAWTPRALQRVPRPREAPLAVARDVPAGSWTTPPCGAAGGQGSAISVSAPRSARGHKASRVRVRRGGARQV